MRPHQKQIFAAPVGTLFRVRYIATNQDGETTIYYQIRKRHTERATIALTGWYTPDDRTYGNGGELLESPLNNEVDTLALWDDAGLDVPGRDGTFTVEFDELIPDCEAAVEMLLRHGKRDRLLLDSEFMKKRSTP